MGIQVQEDQEIMFPASDLDTAGGQEFPYSGSAAPARLEVAGHRTEMRAILALPDIGNALPGPPPHEPSSPSFPCRCRIPAGSGRNILSGPDPSRIRTAGGATSPIPPGRGGHRVAPGRLERHPGEPRLLLPLSLLLVNPEERRKPRSISNGCCPCSHWTLKPIAAWARPICDRAGSPRQSATFKNPTGSETAMKGPLPPGVPFPDSGTSGSGIGTCAPRHRD